MKKILLSTALLASALLAAPAIAADAAAGQAKSATCVGCHGANGMSAIPTYPHLAGQQEAYLLKQLKDFKSGARTDATMNAMVAGLSDADMENLAAYYSSMK